MERILAGTTRPRRARCTEIATMAMRMPKANVARDDINRLLATAANARGDRSWQAVDVAIDRRDPDVC